MWLGARRAAVARRRSIRAALAIIAALMMIRLWLSASALATRQATLVTIAVVFVVLLVVVAVGIKLFDLTGRREERAERVQNRIAEQLRAALGDVPITVVAYASPAARAPLVIELTGSVPTEAARDAILGLVRREAARLGRDIHVADRLEVESVARRPAA
jgi:Ca2+/Na+ antiporter